ncbi:MAG: VWA domain-containing protein, partial [Myxococcales bacterium]|nr:VWA domain-containing protein [Myxococcales bacterium]
PPTLEQLVQVVVDGDAWKRCLEDAFERYLRDFAREVAVDYASLPAEVDAAAALPERVIDTVSMAAALEDTKLKPGSLAAGRLCTEALCVVRHKVHFLPLLDAFLDHGVLPDDVERVVAKAVSLGIDPDEVYDRIGDALRQLQALIHGDSRDADRYMRLVDRVRGIPEELLDELTAQASRCSNLEAMASLLAIDLGGAAGRLTEDQVTQAIGYKGIGGGSNQLRQWFRHRGQLHQGLRAQIKAMTKDALVDLAFDWIGKGGGSGEQGLLPQSATRPYRAGDDLDLLDLDGTLDAIVGAGKRIEDLSAEDLTVQDTSRGRAALAMLIDISGSMSGDDLAVCAIAAVMLLGRVRTEEIALAVFESNTHVLKTFADPTDLDEVADAVLELEATGGTRVDAAFTWAREQLESTSEADFHLLFVLSDFGFFEPPEELARHGQKLADLRVVFLAGTHGHVHDSALQTVLRTTGGRRVELRSVAKLPEVLLETLQQIGDGAFQS